MSRFILGQKILITSHKKALTLSQGFGIKGKG